MIKVAGKLLSKLTANGGDELLKSSIPGAVLSSLFSTVTTGSPVAGLPVVSFRFRIRSWYSKSNR